MRLRSPDRRSPRARRTAGTVMTGDHCVRTRGIPDAEAPPPVVLHVCTRYQRGGSERRIRDSIRAMPGLRHHLVLGRDSDLELADQQTGAERIWIMPSLVRQVSPVRDLAAFASLWRLMRRGRYSAVVSHQSKAGILARSAAALGGPPAVHSLSMASFGPGYGRLENLVFTRLERALGRAPPATAWSVRTWHGGSPTWACRGNDCTWSGPASRCRTTCRRARRWASGYGRATASSPTGGWSATSAAWSRGRIPSCSRTSCAPCTTGCRIHPISW
jgi:hypothetical protein